jgi:tetratricopeptide (TPR) repeat protein
MTLAEVRALRSGGKHAEHLAAASELVANEPDNVDAQIEAAYAHDAAGRERLALRHYEEAYRLGVPAAEHQHFVVGFGSTLRNAGRADEAVAVLARAVVDEPGYMPFHAFLSLALFSAGHPREALAAMLGCALEAARPAAFDRYERALGEYHRELLGELVPPEH